MERAGLSARGWPNRAPSQIADDDDGIRLDRWFKRHSPDISFNIVSRWSRTGQLRLNGKRAAPGDRIEAGQTIQFPSADAMPARTARPERKREPLTEEEAELVREMVIYEDPHAFVLNKPPGLATQGGTKTHHHLDKLLDGLADDDGNRPKLVHRLDKDTSGALAGGEDRPVGRPFRKVLLRPDRAQGLLGAGRRRAFARRRTDRRAACQAAGHGRREDAYRRGERTCPRGHAGG